MFFSIALAAALRGIGDAFTPMKMIIGANLLNIVLDAFLIFGLWGFPRLGVAGSAWATLIARGWGMVYLLWKCFNGRGAFTLHLRRSRFDWLTMKAILNLGIFSSAQAILRNLSGLVIMRFVAIYGTAAAAAYGIGLRLQMGMMVPGFGIGNAVATLVGQNLGADKPERVERTVNRATVLGLFIMTGLGLFSIVFANFLIRIFNSDPEVVRQGTLYLYVTTWVNGFTGISIILGLALISAGDAISQLVIACLSLFLLRIPFALGGAYLWKMTGLFLGVAASAVLQGIIMIVWFRRGHWKHKQISS
jgi:putative MATE family efflux protein